jgi:hypothetical protein
MDAGGVLANAQLVAGGISEDQMLGPTGAVIEWVHNVLVDDLTAVYLPIAIHLVEECHIMQYEHAV